MHSVTLPALTLSWRKVNPGLLELVQIVKHALKVPTGFERTLREAIAYAETFRQGPGRAAAAVNFGVGFSKVCLRPCGRLMPAVGLAVQMPGTPTFPYPDCNPNSDSKADVDPRLQPRPKPLP